MKINLQQEIQVNFKKVILVFLSIPVLLLFVSYLIGEKLHWCTGMFPSTIMSCPNAPFLQSFFSLIWSLFPILFLINIIVIPLTIALVVFMAIRSKSVIPVVILIVIMVHAFITYTFNPPTQNQINLEDTPEISKINPAQTDFVVNPDCNQDSLYGFSYYVQTNTQTVCYKNYEMSSADAASLIPLEGVSREIAQVLIPNVIIEEDFDFAFDKNNFYINGGTAYSVDKKSFEVTRMPAKGQSGAIIVNGRGYTVTMTGLVGATMK